MSRPIYSTEANQRGPIIYDDGFIVVEVSGGNISFRGFHSEKAIAKQHGVQIGKAGLDGYVMPVSHAVLKEEEKTKS